MALPQKAYNHVAPNSPHRLREARLEKGLTLEQATALIGWKDWQRLQRYETGARKLTVENLNLIAQAYNVPPARLLNDGDGVTTEEREMLDWMRSHPGDTTAIRSLYKGLRERAATEYQNNEPVK